jgi:hypothetical protein
MDQNLSRALIDSSRQNALPFWFYEIFVEDVDTHVKYGVVFPLFSIYRETTPPHTFIARTRIDILDIHTGATHRHSRQKPEYGWP